MKTGKSQDTRSDIFNGMMLDRRALRDDPAAWSDCSSEGMVASAHYLATRAGCAILASGGNAFDAAIATSLALGVCEPAGSGLGGMTIVMLYSSKHGHTLVLDGACRAPKMADPELLTVKNRYRGHGAVAVPMNAAVLGYIHKHYGSLKREELFKPAIEIAEEGFMITPMLHRMFGEYQKYLVKGNAASFFLDEKNRVPAVGALLKQPVLAGTLKHMSEKGFEEFYTGDIGNLIAKDMMKNSGFIGPDDLNDVPLPRVEKPLCTELDNAFIHCPGPPAGGVALIEMLNIYNALAGNKFSLTDPVHVIKLAEIIRRSRKDRQKYRLKIQALCPGKASELLTLEYAEHCSRRIARKVEGIGETSHISVMDREGNAVAMTQSIERSFGAAVLTPGLGFLYNGFLRGFKIKNRNHPHYLRPGVPARSNSAPTLILENNRPFIAIGSTGSERASSGIFTVILNLLAGTDPFEAVHAPRLHCTPEGEVLIEAERFPESVIKALENAAYILEKLEGFSFKMGGMNLVARSGDTFTGVSDPRRDGMASGPCRY